jgi:hypothetical protein
MHAKDCVVLLCFTELGTTYPLDEREDVTIRNEWPVIACLLFRLRVAGFFVPKILVSPSTTAPRNELFCPSRTGSSMAEELLGITCMRPSDLLTRTESKRTLQRLDSLQKDRMTVLYTKDLPNATIQPFRVWHPPRMKTGLRNRPVGRKIAII